MAADVTYERAALAAPPPERAAHLIFIYLQKLPEDGAGLRSRKPIGDAMLYEYNRPVKLHVTGVRQAGALDVTAKLRN